MQPGQRSGGGVEAFSYWHGPASTHGGEEYGRTIKALQEFLAAFAAARPDEAALSELTGDLNGWTDRLRHAAVAEDEQVYGRRADLPGRGQATWPAVHYTAAGSHMLEGRVCFDRFFLGRNGVVHGGAVLQLFDEFAGRLSNAAPRPMARTAYVRADFRGPAPIDVELRISVELFREEGRKRFLRATLHHGEVLCVEAEVLMVVLLPGKQ